MVYISMDDGLFFACRETNETNDQNWFKHLKVNKRFYLAPPHTDMNLKDILNFARDKGIGRPIDDAGKAISPWNPKLLAEAISNCTTSHHEIEVRTVQNWFQDDNLKGIGHPNLAKLALVFGCGDDEFARLWRLKLLAAKKKLKNERGYGKDIECTGSKWNMALGADRALHSQSPINLIVLAWAAYSFFGFLTFFYGAHSVTYSPFDGVIKQVGFLWAPHWTILETFVLPLYIFIVHDMLESWKENLRNNLIENYSGAKNNATWTKHISKFAPVFSTILIICVSFVFLFQWIGACSRYIWTGQSSNFAADWAILSSIRPDIIGPYEQTMLSMFGYLFTSAYIWIFLLGLLFVYIVADDFKNIFKSKITKLDFSEFKTLLLAGSRLYVLFLRILSISVWFAICNRLQFKYLMTDSENIISWLVSDFFYSINLSSEIAGTIESTHMNIFTTFIMIVVICVIGSTAMFKILHAQQICITSAIDEKILDKTVAVHYLQNIKKSGLIFTLILFVLSSALLLIGEYNGFTIHLILAFVLSGLSFTTMFTPRDIK